MNEKLVLKAHTMSWKVRGKILIQWIKVLWCLNKITHLLSCDLVSKDALSRAQGVQIPDQNLGTIQRTRARFAGTNVSLKDWPRAGLVLPLPIIFPAQQWLFGFCNSGGVMPWIKWRWNPNIWSNHDLQWSPPSAINWHPFHCSCTPRNSQNISEKILLV